MTPYRVYFDCETYLIQPGTTPPRLVCCAWALNDSAVELKDRDDSIGLFKSLIVREDVTWINQRTCFDLSVLAYACAEDSTFSDAWFNAVLKTYAQKRVRCTNVRQRLINIAKGVGKKRSSLANLVKEYLSIDISSTKKGDDVWRLRYHELDGIPLDEWPAAARDYAIDDVVYARDVFHAQGGSIVSPDEHLQTFADYALQLMSWRGVATDQDAVAKLKAELLEEYDQHEQVAIASGLIRCKTITRGKNKGEVRKSKNTKAIQRAVSLSLGDDVTRTPTGRVAIGADELRRAAAKVEDSDGLAALAAMSKPQKYLSTYISALETDVVNPFYNVLVSSGRTSSSRPNIQNFPRKGGLRECMVARDGYLFAQADYSQIELVSLAHVLDTLFSIESSLTKAINSDMDLHVRVAAELLGISYDECLSRVAAGDDEAKDARQVCKIANYGFAGGMGAETFVDHAGKQDTTITPEQSEAIRNSWFRAWPEMHMYFDYISQLVQDGNGAVTQLGTKRVRGRCTFCQAANTYFQGSTADGCKVAMVNIIKAAYGEGGALRGSYPVIFAHDEFILESPEDKAEQHLSALKRIMVESMSIVLPNKLIKADGKLMNRWSK